MPAGKHELNDNEGTLLALILRIQPATAYQLIKIYSESPVSNFKTGKGKVYPLISRLETLNYVSKSKVLADRRGTEVLRCTVGGKQALKQWLLQIRQDHLLLEDPLRTKLQSFDLLSGSERIEWVIRAKIELHRKLAELDAYRDEVAVPYKDFVHDNAVRSVRARLDWLDLLDLYLRKDAE